MNPRFTVITDLSFNRIIVHDKETGRNHIYHYPDGIKDENIILINNHLKQI